MQPKTFYTNTYNEIFLNIGKKRKKTPTYSIKTVFSWALAINLRMLGWKWMLEAHAFKFNNDKLNNVDRNHVLQIFLIFDDVSKLIKHKKKTQEATVPPVEEKK